MKNESVLILASQSCVSRRRHREIIQSAIETFGNTYVHVSQINDESGWPASCNAMFYSALTHVEQYFGDHMLWLEADAIPIFENWYEIVQEEFNDAVDEGKSFYGSMVLHFVNHLSGIAVYGKNWRKVAPKLAEIVKNGAGIHEAWDTHAADQILPNARITNRIQHMFYAPVLESLSLVKPEAVIFHQDKHSKLFGLLDRELYGGAAARDERWSYLNVETTIMETRFYHSDNASRAIKSQGLSFPFEPYDGFAGSMRGVFATQDERQIAALDAKVSDARSGVTSITREDYEAKSKKKVTESPISISSNPAFEARIINSSPKAVVVHEPSPSPDEATASTLPDSIDSVIQTGTVQPARPVETAPRSKKARPAKLTS